MLAWGSGCAQLYGSADPDSAEIAFETARRGFAQVGDRWGTALALSSLANASQQRNDYHGAVVLTTSALELAENFGCDTDIANLLRQRAANKRKLGDEAGAKADYQRAAHPTPPRT
jgi:hypothetical protein